MITNLLRQVNPIFVLTMITVCSTAVPSTAQIIPIAVQKRTTPVDFRREILPIFRKNCLACHNATDANGELILETAKAILKGGDTGPAVVAKNSANSLLLKVASHRIEPHMPPKGNDVAAKDLTPQQLGLLKLWIDQGAVGSGSANVLSPTVWRALPKQLQPTYAVAVTADGQFAACGRGNRLFIYRVGTGQLVTRLTDPTLKTAQPQNAAGIAHLDIVQSLAFNNAGNLLASGGFRVVKLWRRPSDVRRLNLPVGNPVTAVAVSSDGSLMASASSDNTIKLWSVADGKLGIVLKGHAAAITSLQFSGDGTKLISSSVDKTIRVWKLADGTLLGQIDTSSEVNAITLVKEVIPIPAKDGQPAATESAERLVSAGNDKFVRLWNIPAALPEKLSDVPAQTKVFVVSPDRSLLAIAAPDGTVRVVDFASRKLIHSWKAHTGVIHDMAFLAVPAAPAQVSAPKKEAVTAPIISQLATAADDGTVRIWNYKDGSPLYVLRGSLTAVRSVAWQPDGKRVVAGDSAGRVTVWNLEAEPTRSLPAKTGPARVSAISPNGKLLAASGTSNERAAIIIRDFTSGRITRRLLGHEAPVTALAFNADGTRIVSGSEDKTARVWDLSDARFPEIARMTGHTGTINGVAFNSDSQQVLTGSSDTTVKLWKVSDESLVKNFAGHTAAVVAVAMPGNQPTSASADKTVRVWNPANGQQTRAITVAAAITTMTVSRNNTQLAVGSEDKSLRLYQFANGQLKFTLVGHTELIHSLSFSSDNTRILSSDEAKTAIVWNVTDGRLLELFPIGTKIGSAVYGPNNKTVLIADDTGTIQQHAIRFGVALNGIAKSITSLRWSPNGQTIYTSSEDGTIRGFNLANGQQSFNANHGAPVHELALSPNGQLLASAGENKLVRIWNAAGAAVQPQQLIGFTAAVSSVCFSQDNQRVIAASQAATGELIVFNLVNAGEIEQLLKGHTGAITKIASAGVRDERIVSASADQTIRLSQLHGIRRIAGHSQPVTSLAAIPGVSLQVLSGSRDATLRHWNLVTGQAIRQMNHGGPVLSVAVRGDGQRFASASENNTAKLWNSANGQQLAQMRGDIRAKNRVAKVTQQQADATAKIASEKAVQKAAETQLPIRTTAAKTAADALAKAAADMKTKNDALVKAQATKSAAEQLGIQAAAAAQKAVLAKLQADLGMANATKAVQIATDKLNRAKALVASAPDNQALKTASTAAEQVLAQANTKLQAAKTAQVAPTKAATVATAAAAKAAAVALATNKPFVDASNALIAARKVHKAAAQLSTFAARDAKVATDAVPAAKATVAKAETLLVTIKKDLDTANKLAAAAEKPMRTIAFSPDNLQVATGGGFGAVHTWNADTGVAIASYVGHTGPIHSMAYTTTDALLTGSEDKSAAVWNLNPGWVLERTIGNIDDPTQLIHRVAAIDFSNDDKWLCTGGGVPSRNGELKIWNVADGQLIKQIPNPHTELVYGVSFSRDQRFVASASGDKYVRTFDVVSGERVMQFEGHTDHVLDVSWRANGKTLATCGADNMVMIWNADTGDRLRSIAGFAKQVSAVRFVGATNITVSCSADRIVRLHNSDNGGVVSTFAGTGTDYLYSVDVTPDRRIVVSGGFDGVLRIWNGVAANSQPLRIINPPQDQEKDLTKTAASQ